MTFPVTMVNASGKPEMPKVITVATFQKLISAPPAAPPRQAARNGLPSGSVTPKMSGSPMPNNPTGNAPLMTFLRRALRVFIRMATAAPTCPIPAIDRIGSSAL
ncbi:hypothetical protein D3C76_1436050 [compost metagenome]